jgi:RNA polymerase sigma-70 factor (ECF subfamily)
MTPAHAATIATPYPGGVRGVEERGRRRLDPELLFQNADRLYRAAWFMCGSPEEAEDLVQDTFARVLSRPRFLHSEDDLGYLLRVLRNTFATTRRAAARRLQTVALPDESVLGEAHYDAWPDARQTLLDVFEALAALPEMFRDALIAVDVMGLSYREAARALHVREATFTTRLHRARHHLARRLDV